MASSRRRTASARPDGARRGAPAVLALGAALGGCSAVLAWDRTDDAPADAAPPVDRAQPADAPAADRATPADAAPAYCFVREQCGAGGRCCRNRCAVVQCCEDRDCGGDMSCQGGRCR